MSIQIEIPFCRMSPDVDIWFKDHPQASAVYSAIERAHRAIMDQEIAPGKTGIIMLPIKHQDTPYYLELSRGRSSDQYCIDVFASSAPHPTDTIQIIT
jgi:hypothetical protein